MMWLWREVYMSSLSYCFDIKFNRYFYSIHFYSNLERGFPFLKHYKMTSVGSNNDYKTVFLPRKIEDLKDFYYKNETVNNLPIVSSGEREKALVGSSLYVDLYGDIKFNSLLTKKKFSCFRDGNKSIMMKKNVFNYKNIPLAGDSLDFGNFSVMLGDVFIVRVSFKMGFAGVIL